jgi:ribose 5-phosphate isomerase B
MTKQKYTISIATDHHGIEIKSKIIAFLKSKGHTVLDLGPFSNEPVDYPDYAQKLCKNISDSLSEFGILICGTGIGMSIAANRHSYIRAALCTNIFMAERARAHNNANILILGNQISSEEEILVIVEKFFSSPFEGGRHAQRLAKIR